MKNRIVKLKNGITICEILDKIIIGGTTSYLALDFESNRIIIINPNNIFEIVEKDSIVN